MKQKEFTAECGVLKGAGCQRGAGQGELEGGGLLGAQRTRTGHQMQHADRDKCRRRIRGKQGQEDYSWGASDRGKERQEGL